MTIWFVAFNYRKPNSEKSEFGNAVFRMVLDVFPFIQMQQEIADQFGYDDVVIINWKEMSAIEYDIYLKSISN